MKVYTENQLFHEYRLTYETGATNRSRLASIRECTAGNTCFKPTVFNWSADGGSGFDKTTIPGAEAIPNYNSVHATGDFNGDGLTDLYIQLTYDNGRAAGGSNIEGKTWLANGDGTFTKIIIPDNEAMPDKSRVHATGDFNGDGLTDLYVQGAHTSGRAAGGQSIPGQVWYSDGDGTFTKVIIPGNDAMPNYSKVDHAHSACTSGFAGRTRIFIFNRYS